MNAVAESMLDKQVHARLVANLTEVARTARVPESMLHQSATRYCNQDELTWLKSVRKFRSTGKVGALIQGKQTNPVEMKMMAMASALVRNFIDARVIPLADLLDGDVPDPTVLFVPNFYTVSDGKPLASWQLQQIHSTLLSRFVDQKMTVLYVQNMERMAQHYGDGIADHVKSYVKLGA